VGGELGPGEKEQKAATGLERRAAGARATPAKETGGGGADAGADRSEVTSDQVSQGVTWDVGMALEPAKGDREEPGAVTEKGPDGEDSLDIRGGSGARGEDRQSVLAVGEDSNVPEVPDREEVKEDLKTETERRPRQGCWCRDQGQRRGRYGGRSCRLGGRWQRRSLRGRG